jgi:hypothetical protein
MINEQKRVTVKWRQMSAIAHEELMQLALQKLSRRAKSQLKFDKCKLPKQQRKHGLTAV